MDFNNLGTRKQIQMKNTAWFFGDSFTYGEGCREGFEYYDKIEYDDKRIWTTIVSDKLNLKEKNLGERGCATPKIFSNVIECINEFKEGDYVIISDSLPNRILGVNEKLKKVQSITTDIFEEEYHLDNFFESNDSKYTMMEYLHQNIIPNETVWRIFYERQIEQLQKFLLSKNINCYYWAHELWARSTKKYNRITDHSEGKIDDGHFSWIGHREFSEHILNSIGKKKYIIHKNFI